VRGLICIADLGASLHEVLSLIHNEKATYPQIDLHYDRSNPLTIPVVVSLPQNGFRLRFDGADQRLRLIEVTDFKKISLAYKGSDLVKNSQLEAGPAFKRVYTLFGASYPGEYHSPKNGDRTGRYVLSWAGVAFTFPLQHDAWSPQKDHVSLLGSSAATPATVMAIFEGNSWPEVRHDLFIKPPSGPRLSAVASRPKDNIPAEIEAANICSTEGRIEFLRRPPAVPFTVILNQTTPQDLITELGPPDATHKRAVDPATVQEQPLHKRASSMSNGRAHVEGRGSQPSSYSSTGTDTFDADFDSGDADEDPADRTSRETFWCYFSHGMDVLIGPPSEDGTSTAALTSLEGEEPTPLSASPHLVVTKVILHGNVPGSYAFNRHRRLRWQLSFPNTEYLDTPLTSETKFDDLKSLLLHIFHPNQGKAGGQIDGMGRGKVVNRTWGGGAGGGGSMIESGFYLPDAETELVEGSGSEAWLGNTRLFAFPGLGFEVLENGSVAGVTVY
jgi:hypothetical protein